MQKFVFQRVEYRYTYTHLINKLSSLASPKNPIFYLRDVNSFPAELISHSFQYNKIEPEMVFLKSKDRLEVIKTLVKIDRGESIRLEKLKHPSTGVLIELIKVPKHQEMLKERIIKIAETLTYGQTAIAAAVYPDVTVFADTLKLKNRTFESFEEMLYMIRWMISENINDKQMQD